MEIDVRGAKKSVVVGAGCAAWVSGMDVLVVWGGAFVGSVFVGGGSRRGRLLLRDVDILIVSVGLSNETTAEAGTGWEVVLSEGLEEICELEVDSRSRFLGFRMVDCVSGISKEVDGEICDGC